MPDSELGYAAIESPTHGNVLWVNLEDGRVRIGFALSKELYSKYGERMTLDQAKEEAVKAMAPFSLEWKSVDWWTVYG